MEIRSKQWMFIQYEAFIKVNKLQKLFQFKIFSVFQKIDK